MEDGTMADYPTRPPYFAAKAIRLMAKTCLANDIGPEAVCLLTMIAQQEDSKRYRGAVRFYNEQLMPLVGTRRFKTLAAWRQRAIDAGWLHYESRGHQSGLYWVTVPESALGLEDAPLDENPDELRCDAQWAQSAHECAHGNDSQWAESAHRKADDNAQDKAQWAQSAHGSAHGSAHECAHECAHEGAQLSYLRPIPIPKDKCASAAQTAQKSKLAAQTIRAGFADFWNDVTPKVGRQRAEKHYATAVRLLAKDHDDPIAEMARRWQVYKASGRGQGEYAWEPCAWLREHYDDDQAAWRDRNGRPPVAHEDRPEDPKVARRRAEFRALHPERYGNEQSVQPAGKGRRAN